MLVNSGQLLNSGVGRVGTSTANAAGTPLLLNLKNRISTIVTVLPGINAANTWQLQNDANSLEFYIIFEIAALGAQTFPADWQVTNLIGNWDGADWTPLDLGKYQAHGIYDGTNWVVEIIGLIS